MVSSKHASPSSCSTIRFGRSEARFRREANIVARLTHPNIAHLIDAGVSSDGQPYLVLELVDGQPIDDYCDDRRLSVPSRIALFLDVLGAVAHAHTHRIVHRDIKPPNVLVRTDGHVKLLDFGIAKLLEPDGQPAKMSTLTLEQGAGLTPAYAAPEQVRGGQATTATDVYALGLLLYVLLTGQHPWGELTSPADLFKAIVEVDAPPPSASVVAGKVPARDLATRAANRATTPDGLHRLLKGDLDTIVGKALEKNPAERYPSVGELAEDLRRHLASEPIRARRESLGRRAVRFARRHAALTSAAAAGALALAAVTGYYAIRPPVERERGAPPESQAPAPVTSQPGDERWPNLAPDHTRIAFAWIAPATPGGRIATKALGSDEVSQLTDGADDSNPVWSPDGQQIAFVRTYREPEPRTQICLIPAIGGSLRVLHTTGLSLPGLAWWKERQRPALRGTTCGKRPLSPRRPGSLDARGAAADRSAARAATAGAGRLPPRCGTGSTDRCLRSRDPRRPRRLPAGCGQRGREAADARETPDLGAHLGTRREGDHHVVAAQRPRCAVSGLACRRNHRARAEHR